MNNNQVKQLKVITYHRLIDNLDVDIIKVDAKVKLNK